MLLFSPFLKLLCVGNFLVICSLVDINTLFEDLYASSDRKSTGMEPPVILNDDVEREESNYTQEMEQLVEMIFSVPSKDCMNLKMKL